MGYKAKTIKAILRKKVDEWLKSIDDEELRKTCRNEAIVTGGAIASMLLGEHVNDFDIYFRKVETVQRVSDYYVKKFSENRKPQGGIPVDIRTERLLDTRGKDRVRIVVQSAGVAGKNQESDYDYFEMSNNDHDAGAYVTEAFDGLADVAKTTGVFDNSKVLETSAARPTYEPVFLSSNAISLSGKIQLVLRFYGDPDEIHENYDFAHCMNYWESGSSQLTLRPQALETLLSRTLVYNGSLYPICSIIRTRKFIERGWKINAGQYLKMAMQVSDLDLYDHVVLEEQLTGVDVAYFTEIISKIKEKNPEKVDATYLIEIIDRMF